jgi:hypothetical protein
MKKLNLNVDELCVESFSTLSATQRQSGTVEAHEYSQVEDTCLTNPGGGWERPTDPMMCSFGVTLCDGTCGTCPLGTEWGAVTCVEPSCQEPCLSDMCETFDIC